MCSSAKARGKPSGPVSVVKIILWSSFGLEVEKGAFCVQSTGQSFFKFNDSSGFFYGDSMVSRTHAPHAQ
ncbi:MAG: hypothetical protein NWS28_12230, partial [Limnohabitans sp.]|nr:hypothetical protein [Limnohabitans sp.]